MTSHRAARPMGWPAPAAVGIVTADGRRWRDQGVWGRRNRIESLGKKR
jgi:hypothetical protein